MFISKEQILIYRKIPSAEGYKENIYSIFIYRKKFFCESVNQKNFLLQIDFQNNTCLSITCNLQHKQFVTYAF